MASNKNKFLEAAQKYVEKGQFDKAIKEYQRVVAEDPKDVRVWLKIGDLHAKRGAKSDATDTYLKVAQFYGEQGFFLKGVAVYKQVLRLDPRRFDVNLKLAEVYRSLGQMSEASQQYDLVAAAYLKDGRTAEARQTIRDLVEIDPQNVAPRIRLAEYYSQDGLISEAIAQFEQAATLLKDRNRTDDYIKVAERLVWHRPDDLATCRELAAIYLARQDWRRALQKLQVCFQANPRDVETLTMLAQAFQALGQLAKVASVLKELAQVYVEDGNDARADEVYAQVLLVAPDDEEALDALGRQPRAGARAPEPVVGIPTVVLRGAAPAPIAHAGSRPVAAVHVALPTTGPKWRVTGSVPLLTDPFETESGAGAVGAPEEAGGTGAYGSAGESEFDVDLGESVNAMDVSLDDPMDGAGDGAMDYALDDAVDGGPGGVETGANFALDAEETGANFALDAEETEASVAAHVASALQAPEIARILSEAAVYTKYGLVDRAIEHLGRVMVLDPGHVGARVQRKALLQSAQRMDDVVAELADLVKLTAHTDAVASRGFLAELRELAPQDPRARRVEPAIKASRPASAYDGVRALPAVPAPIHAVAPVAERAAAGPVAGDSAEALELDFALELDRTEGAADVQPASVMDGTDQIEAELLALQREAGADDFGEETDASGPWRRVATEQMVARVPNRLEDDLEEAEFFIAQGMHEDAHRLLAGLRARHPGNPLVAAKIEDLAAALPADAGALPDDAGASADDAGVPADDAGDGGVAAQAERAILDDVHDPDAHFHAGVALEQMGLFDEALVELEQVEETSPHRAAALLEMGRCHAGRGRHDQAVRRFKRGLHVDHVTNAQALELYYELGRTYEAQGDLHESHYYFEKVMRIDGAFKDVAERLGAGARVTGVRGASTRDGDPPS